MKNVVVLLLPLVFSIGASAQGPRGCLGGLEGPGCYPAAAKGSPYVAKVPDEVKSLVATVSNLAANELEGIVELKGKKLLFTNLKIWELIEDFFEAAESSGATLEHFSLSSDLIGKLKYTICDEKLSTVTYYESTFYPKSGGSQTKQLSYTQFPKN